MTNRATMLLPLGLYDVLPPAARHEVSLVSRLLNSFTAFGYDQVAPPLLEFEHTLLHGRGESLSHQTFRVMDPRSHRIMGLRADITMQVARIATTRLAGAPRPLRLSYAGPILSAQALLLQERQATQVGIELFGAGSPEADGEVILVTAEALRMAGLEGLTLDLNLPGVVDALLAQEPIDSAILPLIKEAVTHKDSMALRQHGLSACDTLIGLIASAGPAEKALRTLESLPLPPAAQALAQRLRDVVRTVNQAMPELTLSIDVAEQRGFEYHAGIRFSIFAGSRAVELGSGGHYMAEIDGQMEEATGATLYVHRLHPLLPAPESPARVFLPAGTPWQEAVKLRSEGYATLQSLEATGDYAQEARRLACGYIYVNREITKL